MLKKITMILNGLTIICMVIFSFPMWVSCLVADSEEPLMTLGGADGPTAIFISTRVNPVFIIMPLAFGILLLMNILVIWKQKK